MALDRFEIVVIPINTGRRRPLGSLEISSRVTLTVTRCTLLVAFVAGQRASLCLAPWTTVLWLFRVARRSQYCNDES
jgi:hypothetical protein